MKTETTKNQYEGILVTEISNVEVQAYNLMTGGNFTNDPKELNNKILAFLGLAEEVRKVRDARI